MRLPAVLTFLAAWALVAGDATSARALTPQQWRADLHVLADRIENDHREPFRRASRAAFDSSVAELDRRIPGLSDHQVIAGLARIAALIGDGHTRIELPEDPRVGFTYSHGESALPPDTGLVFHHLPVRLEWYSDGLFVRAATPEFARVVGARVLRIGNASADSALAAIRPLLSCDNDMGFRLLAPRRLEIPELLHALGLASASDHAAFVLRDTLGREWDLDLPSLPQFRDVAWVEARGAGPAPVWLRHPGDWYWMDDLEPQGILYVRVNRIGDAPGESFAAFARKVGDYIGSHPVGKVALDLRTNSGGDNSRNRALVLVLVRSLRVDRPGRLFVIVGRGTFSAAMNLASELEFWSAALFVGEPTGARPSGYGDPRKIILPNSGLTARVSTVYWRDWSGDEDRTAIAPDIPAELSSLDYRRDRDPALAAIRDYVPPADLASLVRDALRRGGRTSAALAYFRFRTDPANAGVESALPMTRLGDQLAREGKLDDAILVYSLVARDYPNHAPAFEGLGRAHLARKETREAIGSFERAQAIDPRNARVRSILDSLRTAGPRIPSRR